MPSQNSKYVLDNYCESPLLPLEIPNDVTHVYIKKYKYPIVDNIWPDSVTHLIVIAYDHQIQVLPENLVVLRFEFLYNYELPKLPNSLKILELSYHDANLLNLLVNSGQHIYNAKLPDLPNGLEVLRLDFYYCHELALPDSLKELYLRDYDNKFLILPNNLEILIIKNCNNPEFKLSALPDTLTTLQLGYYHNHELPELSELPANLTTLKLRFWYNQKLPKLPSNLTTLKLGCCYNQELPKLPASLTTLILSGEYNKPLPELSPNLRILKLPDYHYNQELPILPTSLRILKLGIKYNQKLPTLMPPNFECLHLRCQDNTNMILPINLKCVVLYRNCEATIYENTEIYYKKCLNPDTNFTYSQNVYKIDGVDCHKLLNYPKKKVPVSEISIQQRLDALEFQIETIWNKLNRS